MRRNQSVVARAGRVFASSWPGHVARARVEPSGVGLGAWRDKLLEDRRVQQIHGQSSRDMAICYKIAVGRICLFVLSCCTYIMGELWSYTGEQRFCSVQHFQSKESDWVSFCGNPLALYHIVPFCYPETCTTIVRLFQVSSISFYACVQGIENDVPCLLISGWFSIAMCFYRRLACTTYTQIHTDLNQPLSIIQ